VEERCITVPGRVEYLAQIADFVHDAVHDAGWDEDANFRIQMAVDEACSNIIEHAYGSDQSGNIDVSCCVKDKGDLVITIHDMGKPFDPLAVPDPPVGTCLDDLPAGGLGLYFMRKLMDKVEFCFDERDGNMLTMIKRRRK